jgi:hypothetical protein
MGGYRPRRTLRTSSRRVCQLTGEPMTSPLLNSPRSAWDDARTLGRLFSRIVSNDRALAWFIMVAYGVGVLTGYWLCSQALG